MTKRILATTFIGILWILAGSQTARAQVVQRVIHCGKCEVRSYEARGNPAHDSASRTGVCYAKTTKWLGQERVDDNCFETHEQCFASVRSCLQSTTRPR
jgi:hypothetical protein